MLLTHHERLSLNAQLEQLEASVLDIEYEEFQLTRRLAALHLERRSLGIKKLRVTNTANSPIQALPNEILSHIFSLEAASARPIVSQQRINIVAQICHRFREAALSTPSFWTYIDMKEGGTYEKSRAHLERSGACPLTVNLDIQGKSFGHWEKDFLLSTLSSQLHRCRSFHISTESIEPLQATLPFFATMAAPYLEKFEVFYFGEEGGEETWTPTPSRPMHPLTLQAFGGDAPRLRSLTISGLHPPWDTFPLTSLEEFGFDFHSRDVNRSSKHFIQIITASPKLRRLTIMQGGYDLRLDFSTLLALPEESTPTIITGKYLLGRVVSLPSLEDLVHTFTETQLACDIFNMISAPNLRSLTMEYIKGDCAPLLSGLSGSPPTFPKVSHLRMVGLTSIGAGAMLKFLRSVAPNVTNFHVNAVNCPTLKEMATMLRWLAMERREYLMPKLQEVISEGLSPRNLREMIQSRPKELRPAKITMRKKDLAAKDDQNLVWLKNNVILNMVDGSSDDEDN